MSFPHNVFVQIFGDGNSVELFWIDFEDDNIIPIQYQPHHNDGKCLIQLCVETKLVMMVATKIRRSLCIVQCTLVGELEMNRFKKLKILKMMLKMLKMMLKRFKMLKMMLKMLKMLKMKQSLCLVLPSLESWMGKVSQYHSPVETH